MSTFKQVIINELNNRLGRTATTDDIYGAFDYISDWLGGIRLPELSDIVEALDAYLHDEYVQCEICGTYHKPENMVEVHAVRTCGCNDCRQQAEDDYNHDPYMEWGTY